MRGSIKILTALTLFSFVAGSLALPASGQSGGWEYQTVNINGQSAAFDLCPSGSAHVSYAKTVDNELTLMEATNMTGSWTSGTVDSDGNTGEYGSIAVDSSGTAHISYMSPALGLTNYLYYAVGSGSSWSVTKVDDSPSSGYETSIALDGAGNPHIAYEDYNHGLKYAVLSGGTWSTEIIDADGGSPSIAVDGAGVPHISYLDMTNADLKFASGGGGSWSIETADSAGSVGYDSSLALDSSGSPHIAYIETVGDLDNDMKYARKTGDSWSAQTIDTGDVSYDGGTSIDIDAADTVHIAYTLWTDVGSLAQTVKYQRFDGTEWTDFLLDEDKAYLPHIDTHTTGAQDTFVSIFYAHSGSSGTGYKIATLKDGETPSDPPPSSNPVVDSGGSSMVIDLNNPVKFNLDADEHEIELTAVNDTGATVVVSSTPQTLDLLLNQTESVDTDGNGLDDLSVTLDSVDAAAQSAVVTLKALAEDAGGPIPDGGDGIPGFGAELVLLAVGISVAVVALARRRE